MENDENSSLSKHGMVENVGRFNLMVYNGSIFRSDVSLYLFFSLRATCNIWTFASFYNESLKVRKMLTMPLLPKVNVPTLSWIIYTSAFDAKL